MASDLITDIRGVMGNKEIAPNIIEQVIDEITALWAGINVYVPNRRVDRSNKSKADICRDYQNGVSVNELVRKHGVTQAWIYKIIKDGKAT